MSQITMPKMSDTMEEGKVIRWLKHEGDAVCAGEPVAEIETDKANVEMEAFETGVIKHIIVGDGGEAAVGAPIAEIEVSETASCPETTPPSVEAPELPQVKAPEAYATEQVPGITAPAAQTQEVTPPPAKEAPKSEEKEERVLASPIARRLAEERGIDLTKITGTGPNGRIVEADITGGEAPAKEAPAQPETKVETPKAEEGQEPSRMRAVIAERMTRSKQTIPHFYVTTEVDMTWASRVRDELNQDEGAEVSFNDMIMKACALALVANPNVNASYIDGKIVEHKEINVGMAVAVKDGLIVPVVHNADKLSLIETARTTRELADRARRNAPHAADLQGATFTVSNLGMFDVEEFSAIINPPEAASVAVGSIRSIPVAIDEELAISKRMKMTISADHRVLDGATAAKFMQTVKKNLESPTRLL